MAIGPRALAYRWSLVGTNTAIDDPVFATYIPPCYSPRRRLSGERTNETEDLWTAWSKSVGKQVPAGEAADGLRWEELHCLRRCLSRPLPQLPSSPGLGSWRA